MKRATTIGISIIIIILLVAFYFALRKTPSPKNAAVAGGTHECMDLGKNILLKGGSAVDSAIAVMLCEGVTAPQSSGLGGGLIALVFIKETGTIETLNSREVAPLAATRDMFDNAPPSHQDGLSIAVPAALKGLFELHKRYGKLDWKDVVLPVADIAENGFAVTIFLEKVLIAGKEQFKALSLFK